MKRNYGLDILKLICSFMVICIHIEFPGLVGTIVTPITRIAVPIFFLITGYFYSHTKDNKKETIQISKIFKIFIGANLLYLFYKLFRYLINGKTIAEFLYSSFNIKAMIKFVFLNESPFNGHLWYLGAILYVLIIVYLWERRWNIEKLYPVIPFLLLADLIFGKYSLLIIGRPIPFILVRNFLCVGLPYFLIGDLLFKIKPKIKSIYLLLFSLLLICTTLLERYLLGIMNLNAERDHYISTTFLAISIFMLATQYVNRKENACIEKLSFMGAKLSLGIYIIHPIFINIINKLVGDNTISTIYSYTAPFWILIISTIVSWGAYKLNYKMKIRAKKK